MTAPSFPSLLTTALKPKFLIPTSFLVAALAVLVSAGAVSAQLTTESLIGDSVSDIGTRYSDIDEAIKRFSNRDVLGARTFLETAVRKNPQLPPVEMLMAKMYIMTGNSSAGRASLEATAKDHPGDPEPFIIMGEQAVNAGQTIEAEALFDKALSLIDQYNDNPKRKRNFVIHARNGHAWVAERREDWETAAEDLQLLLDSDPDNAGAHYRMGRALFMLDGRQREGFEHFQKASEVDEKVPNPYVAAAMVYERKGAHEDARKAFERAVSDNRDDLKTLSSYAQWLLKTGDVPRAEQVLAAARKADPNSLEILTLSGVAARMAKKVKPAEDYFMEALRLDPSNGGVINQLALLLIDQPDDDKRQRAGKFAQINATLRPDSPEANITLSWVLYKLGNNRDAGNAFQRGLRQGSLTADSSYYVAQMLVEQNRLEMARQLLDNALETSDDNLFIMRNEAEALRNTL